MLNPQGSELGTDVSRLSWRLSPDGDGSVLARAATLQNSREAGFWVNQNPGHH